MMKIKLRKYIKKYTIYKKKKLIKIIKKKIDLDYKKKKKKK